MEVSVFLTLAVDIDGATAGAVAANEVHDRVLTVFFRGSGLGRLSLLRRLRGLGLLRRLRGLGLLGGRSRRRLRCHGLDLEAVILDECLGVAARRQFVVGPVERLVGELEFQDAGTVRVLHIVLELPVIIERADQVTAVVIEQGAVLLIVGAHGVKVFLRKSFSPGDGDVEPALFHGGLHNDDEALRGLLRPGAFIQSRSGDGGTFDFRELDRSCRLKFVVECVEGRAFGLAIDDAHGVAVLFDGDFGHRGLVAEVQVVIFDGERISRAAADDITVLDDVAVLVIAVDRRLAGKGLAAVLEDCVGDEESIVVFVHGRKGIVAAFRQGLDERLVVLHVELIRGVDRLLGDFRRLFRSCCFFVAAGQRQDHSDHQKEADEAHCFPFHLGSLHLQSICCTRV